MQVERNATSLGAVESTIERRAGIPGQGHLPPSLLRLSVGIEDVGDLWADLDAALIERERQVYLEQARATGKSEEIIGKMVEGRLRKEFFGSVVLNQQVFVIDGKATVAEAVKAAEKMIGAPIKITKFVRYALGEGIEKKEEDFAAEVAKAVKGG